MAQQSPSPQNQLETLGLLAGGVAHDFNNILTSIIGQTDMALIKLPEDDDARPHIENAARAAQFATRLAHQLLTLARGEEVAAESFNLNTLIQENEILLRMLLLNNAALELSLSHEGPIIFARQLDLQQVLLNLVVNAAQALPEKGGKISVRTRITRQAHDQRLSQSRHGRFPHGFVMLQIEDNGSGIDQATLAKIFEPHFTTRQTGKGMGLNLVQQIVANYNGGITVDSQPGHGTTFTIFLPYQSLSAPIN